MTSRARLFVSLFAALAAVAPAAADPLHLAVRLAAQDGGGGGGAPPAPARPAMLADVAGPATSIGLPELLALAVRTAPTLAQARIDIEVAEASILSTQAWADWALQAQAAGSTRVSGGAFSRADDVTLSADLTRRISSGGTLSLHAETGYTRQDFLVMGIPGTTRNYDTGVSIGFTQPLMRGRGKAQLFAAERAARTSRDAADVATRAAAIALVRDVVLSYLGLKAAERELEISRASLDLANERLKVTLAGIDKGGVAKAETIPVEQAIATREEAVLAGELTILDQSLALRRQVGMPSAPGDMVLASTVDLAIPSKTWDQVALVTAASTNSPELARLAALEAGATIEIEVTENGLLPSLDLAASIGPSVIVTDPTGAFDTSTGVTAAVTLTYQQAIGKTAARAEVRRSRAQRESLRVNASDVKNQIVEAVARAVAQIQVAERRYAIAVRAVSLAEQNLAVEQARLGLGKSRNVDVLTRQDELRAAQLRVANAVIDWHRADAAIAALTGEILPRYGISIDAK